MRAEKGIRWGIYDWIKLLDELQEEDIHFFPVEWVMERTGKSKDSLRVAMNRLEKKRILTRVGRKWIMTPPLTLAKVIPHVWKPAYLSLEWALNYHGILDQVTYQHTAVTTGKEGQRETRIGSVELHHIPKKLFFGFNEELIAHPEKAILDMMYLKRELKMTSELNWEFVDRKKLRNYAQEYPKRVQELVQALERTA